jgi:hypothetical protein
MAKKYHIQAIRLEIAGRDPEILDTAEKALEEDQVREVVHQLLAMEMRPSARPRLAEAVRALNESGEEVYRRTVPDELIGRGRKKNL